MKKEIFVYLILSILISSCKNKTEKKMNKDEKKVSSTTEIHSNEDAYHPGSDWKLDWADEFEAKQIDTTNWNFQEVEAGRFNDEWQRYTKSEENAYVEDNCLVIKALHVSGTHGKDQYTSARLNTAQKQTWKYGKIAARIKLPEGQGIWPAFWMLGNNIDENGGDTPWPQCGEIDILELYGSKDDAAIEVNAHYANASDQHESMGAVTYTLPEGKFSDAFHIFEFEWDANQMIWFVDGKQIASMPISAEETAEFQKEFFLLLNIAVGGTFAGRPDNTTSFPQYMYVDWIRVYQKEMG